MGENVVLQHAVALLVSPAKAKLTGCVSLLGRLPEPIRGAGVVLLDAPALVVQVADCCLRVNIALLSKRPTQPKSKQVVLPVVSRFAIVQGPSHGAADGK